MYKSICILGRQPALGLVELESLYGAAAVRQVGSHAAGIDLPVSEIDFNRLGGSTRLATVIGEVSSTDWRMIEKALVGLARSPALTSPVSGKFHLGLSAIGFSISPAKLNATGLTLKKIIRSRHDGSVRLVPNTEPELNTAQVFHNHLASDSGCELLIIAQGNATIIARTVAVQDIDSYTLRDRGRPKRDARVGMLPPKLAQIIINLAAGQVDKKQGPQELDTIASARAHSASASEKRAGEERAGSERSDTDTRGRGEAPPQSTKTLSDISAPTLLDPFCGTGVVLQEALLMGYNVYGTDLEPRMITYSQANLEWFMDTYDLCDNPNGPNFKLEAGDATTHQWNPTPDFVACETYLGRPFTERPAPDVLAQTVSDVNLIIKRFLQNIHAQLAPGTRLCLAVPAWQIAPGRFRQLPLISDLDKSPIKRVKFVHVSNDNLLYYREDQIVARELLVLEKI